ncbi:MAG: exosortase F system-associated protein [Flavobacteriaceae bacterium]|nr:exosortase F system-associated protein [Flavobacteriaceae bacterium]
MIRIFEGELFYDPLISFFKLDHSTEQLPQFDDIKLVGFVALRFLMTTVISLGVLWVLFRKKDIIKLAGFLYIVLFVVLLVVFIFLIQSSESGGHLTLFYVRRFLIQPIFLLLLIPAFYFQKKT